MATQQSRARAANQTGQRSKQTGAALLVLLSAAAAPETRTQTQNRLEAAEKSRQAVLAESTKAAKTLAVAQAESARLAAERIQAATRLRDIESQVLSAAAKLHQARQRSTEADAALHKREADFAALLPIMLRLSRYPSETVLAVPLPPQQALEGLLITRGLAARLQQEAAALKAQQSLADTLRRAAMSQQAELTGQRRRQHAAAAALDRQITSTEHTIDQTGQEIRAAEEQAAAQAAQAETLRGAVAAMDAARAHGAAEAAGAAKRARIRNQVPEADAALAREAALTRPALHGPAGPLQRPVAGPILRAWGSPAEDGPATGITYGTAPGAFVSSPCAGRVAFAAPFRSYGKLVIIECANGMDFVLAGLDRINAPVGRTVHAGEPVGRMADTDAGALGHAGLYLELRRDGQAQDPTPFLNARG